MQNAGHQIPQVNKSRQHDQRTYEIYIRIS